MQLQRLRSAALVPIASRWRTYSLFAFGVLTSALGDRMALIAIAADFYQRTGQGLAVGVSLALLFAPSIVFMLVGGYLADRYSRPLLIVVSHLAGAAAALALALSPPLPVMLVLVLALGSCQAVSTPAVRALVADVVPGEDELTRGYAIFSVFANACFLAGPAVAGVLFAFSGAGLVFVIDALTFLVSAGALTIIRRRRVVRRTTATPSSGSLGARLATIASGVTILWSTPKTRGVAISIVAVVLAGSTLSGALIGVAEQEFHAGSVGFGALTAGTGLGLLLGGLYLVARPRRDIDHWLARGIGLMAMGYATVAAAPVLLLTAGGLVVSGTGNAFQNVSNSVLIQRTLPRDEHGRAFGALLTFSNLAQVPGVLVGGALLDVVPVRLVSLGCALLMGPAPSPSRGCWSRAPWRRRWRRAREHRRPLRRPGGDGDDDHPHPAGHQRHAAAQSSAPASRVVASVGSSLPCALGDSTLSRKSVSLAAASRTWSPALSSAVSTTSTSEPPDPDSTLPPYRGLIGQVYRFADQLAIWARELKPSLLRMPRMWLATVLSDMKSRAPISLLVKPSATKRATSISRFPRTHATSATRACADRPGGFAKCQPDGLVPAQGASSLELGLEPGRPQRHGCRLPGLIQQGGHEWHDPGAGAGPDRLRGPQQARRRRRLAGAGGEAAQGVEQIVLRHPVIDLASTVQRLGEEWLRFIEVRLEESNGAAVHQHHGQAVDVAGFTADANAFG
jgi:MFS family permease